MEFTAFLSEGERLAFASFDLLELRKCFLIEGLEILFTLIISVSLDLHLPPFLVFMVVYLKSWHHVGQS